MNVTSKKIHFWGDQKHLQW